MSSAQRWYGERSREPRLGDGVGWSQVQSEASIAVGRPKGGVSRWSLAIATILVPGEMLCGCRMRRIAVELSLDAA